MGIETEYALVGLAPDGSRLPRGKLASGLLFLAQRELCNLAAGGMDKGIFLANGARFYIDVGSHPEFCTPECTDPSDVVRYVSAGDRILERLAAQIERKNAGLEKLMLFRNNVDYSGSRTTWACHESYHMRPALHTLPDEWLIPHLVSRVVYAGGGGFDSRSAGLEFVLSPRAPHMMRETTECSTGDRGILHSKDESLAERGSRRLHLLCGDSLCSHTASWLKLGTTALVVRLVEAGVRPGLKYPLKNALGALRTFSRDPTCRATVRLENGDDVSAVDIQRRILRVVERRLDIMPGWAPAVVAAWRDVLDCLESDPARLDATLDWRIKLALYAAHSEQRGIASGRWGLLSNIVRYLHSRYVALDNLEEPFPETLLDRRGPLASQVRGMLREMSRHEVDLEQLEVFLDLRDQLFEIDSRFAQIGPDGIFNALDRSGVLDHAVAGMGDIDEATQTPPSRGRARARGEAIREASRSGPCEVFCNWNCLMDFEKSRILDLSNPFEEHPSWRPFHTDGRGDPRISRVPSIEVEVSEPAIDVAATLRRIMVGEPWR
jgi:proteasome accessory factor A